MRVNQGQEFVIAAYTHASRNFDAIFGHYDDQRRPIYVASHAERFHPGLQGRAIQAVPRPGDGGVSIGESAGGAERALGARKDSEEDGQVPLASVGANKKQLITLMIPDRVSAAVLRDLPFIPGDRECLKVRFVAACFVRGYANQGPLGDQLTLRFIKDRSQEREASVQ
jgi:hypothetical protein